VAPARVNYKKLLYFGLISQLSTSFDNFSKNLSILERNVIN
jgi:hypothetical protein